MSPRPPSSRRPWHPPRRVHENRIATGTGLDANRQEKQRRLQKAVLRGSKRAAQELREMGVAYWWRDGRVVLE